MEPKLLVTRYLASFTLHPGSAKKLSRSFCAKRGVVILNNLLDDTTEKAIVGVRAADSNLHSTLTSWLRRDIEFVLLNEYELQKAISIVFDNSTQYDDVDLHIPYPASQEVSDDPVDILNHMLAKALEYQASDIHIETYNGDCDVRLRIDGISCCLSG